MGPEVDGARIGLYHLWPVSLLSAPIFTLFSNPDTLCQALAQLPLDSLLLSPAEDTICSVPSHGRAPAVSNLTFPSSPIV